MALHTSQEKKHPHHGDNLKDHDDILRCVFLDAGLDLLTERGGGAGGRGELVAVQVGGGQEARHQAGEGGQEQSHVDEPGPPSLGFPSNV